MSADDKPTELEDVQLELRLQEARFWNVYESIGINLAKKYGYEDCDGIDGVYRFLIEKHHWLPHEVRSLSLDDVNMLIDKSDYEDVQSK